MSSGERPIGAAKGKQPNTEALCQSPPRSPQGRAKKGWGVWERGSHDRPVQRGHPKNLRPGRFFSKTFPP